MIVQFEHQNIVILEWSSSLAKSSILVIKPLCMLYQLIVIWTTYIHEVILSFWNNYSSDSLLGLSLPLIEHVKGVQFPCRSLHWAPTTHELHHFYTHFNTWISSLIPSIKFDLLKFIQTFLNCSGCAYRLFHYSIFC